jgi:hypothetical protein
MHKIHKNYRQCKNAIKMQKILGCDRNKGTVKEVNLLHFWKKETFCHPSLMDCGPSPLI